MANKQTSAISAKPKSKSRDAQVSRESGGSFAIDPELIASIKDLQVVPIPEKDDYWQIAALDIPKLNGTKILGIFKRKTLKLEEINALRKAAQQSPGNTRTKIQKLKKQFPNHPTLFMLSAICTNGMLMNSSNQKELLKGLKSSTKEASMALLSNGVSLYNCDNFFRIYFTFIDRFKRNLVRTYEAVNHEPRLHSSKKPLIIAMRIIDQLTGEKTRIFKVLNHMKKKIKSSQYTTRFDFKSVSDAGKYIEMGKPKEKCAVGTASEMIAYIYALAVVFARIPILTSLVDEILRLLPDSNKALLLRKISIRSVRNFSRFRIASAESDRSKMAKIGKIIYKDNLTGVQKLDGESLYQTYETDPFFNLAFIAELSVGLYESDDHTQLVDSAVKAVDSVVNRDMSKNHIFTEAASNHSLKLLNIRDGMDAQAYNEKDEDTV